MIVYVNGDSHSAGAELVQNFDGLFYVFKEDDSRYWRISNTPEGRAPHPECVNLSYGKLLADQLGAELVCDAESGCSNTRIFRTTREYLKTNRPDLLVIGWSTYEREEWLHDGQYYQVCGGGIKSVPIELVDRYKEYVIHSLDPAVINPKTVKLHQDIVDLHEELDQKQIPHIFFNTFHTFHNINNLAYLGLTKKYEWDDNFIDPYTNDAAYYFWLKNQNYQTVNSESYHYGPAGHRAWAEHLYQNYVQKALTKYE